MKTQFFFLLVIALAVFACQSDNEFAEPTTPTDASIDPLQNDLVVLEEAKGTGVCMDILANHRLNGTGKPQGSTVVSAATRGVYDIIASGEVISDPLGVGTSRLRFTYNSKTMAVSGTLVSQFESGEVFDQQFNAIASRTINGTMMSLRFRFDTGTLNTESEVYNLVEDAMTITMPVNPSGTIKLTITTKGTYCTEG